MSKHVKPVIIFERTENAGVRDRKDADGKLRVTGERVVDWECVFSDKRGQPHVWATLDYVRGKEEKGYRIKAISGFDEFISRFDLNEKSSGREIIQEFIAIKRYATRVIQGDKALQDKDAEIEALKAQLGEKAAPKKARKEPKLEEVGANASQ